MPPEVETRNEVVVLRPLGDLDLTTADSVRSIALAHVANETHGLVLDLGRARYLDSLGISVLFAIANRLEEHRQRLALVVPPESPMHRSLAIVDMQSRASLHATVDEAVAAVRGAP